MPSILFYSPKQDFTNSNMENFVKSGGVCRREILIGSIGGSIQGATSTGECCDICNAHPISSRLSIFGTCSVTRKKRRKAVRTVDADDLERRLRTARRDFMDQHPGFRMLGIEFVCPDSSIKKIRDEAKYIANAEDFPSEMRSELKDVFLHIITSSQ